MSHRRTPAVALILTLSLTAAVCQGQADEPDNPVDTAPATMRENIQRLIQGLSQIPSWDQERDNMLNAVGQVFESNGWNSESDMFALDLIHELEALPPTAFQQRFDTLVGALSDRYMLSEDQEKTMRRTIQRETHDIFMKHSGRIMQYGLEALQTRVAGEPFTPEQVARWTTLAEPVFLDARERVRGAAERFMTDLDPQQQELLRRDIDADMRRQERVLEMAQGWKRGEWKASDWGMDQDPIQSAANADDAAAAAAERAGAAGSETQDGRAPSKAPPGEDQPPQPPDADHGTPPPAPPPDASSGAAPQPPPVRAAPAGASDNDPWAVYTRGVVQRYSLDDTQQQRAWLIYTEVRKHRDQLIARAAARSGNAAPPAAAGANATPATSNLDEKQKASVDRLFEQLKRRLERLPTRAQRKAAAANPEPARDAKPRGKP